MGSTIDPMIYMQRGAARRPLPRPSVSMSLQLVIPWRVALQQSSPPLHQPVTILKQMKQVEKGNLLNGMCANRKLSQRRGSPHDLVSNLCPEWMSENGCGCIPFLL